jgi:hypothetical protein
MIVGGADPGTLQVQWEAHGRRTWVVVPHPGVKVGRSYGPWIGEVTHDRASRTCRGTVRTRLGALIAFDAEAFTAADARRRLQVQIAALPFNPPRVAGFDDGAPLQPLQATNPRQGYAVERVERLSRLLNSVAAGGPPKVRAALADDVADLLDHFRSGALSRHCPEGRRLLALIAWATLIADGRTPERDYYKAQAWADRQRILGGQGVFML